MLRRRQPRGQPRDFRGFRAFPRGEASGCGRGRRAPPLVVSGVAPDRHDAAACSRCALVTCGRIRGVAQLCRGAGEGDPA